MHRLGSPATFWNSAVGCLQPTFQQTGERPEGSASCRDWTSLPRHTAARRTTPPGSPWSTADQIEYVPVPPDPVELDPLPLLDPLLDDENDDPLDLLPDPLLEEPVDEPLVEPDPEADALAEPDALVADVAEASFTPLVAASTGRSLWVHTPSAE